MTDQPAAPGSLPSIQKYLLTRIVGIVVFSFVVFGVAAWLIVLRPVQDELARVEMDRAATQVEADISSLIGQIERMLVTSRDWAHDGMLRIDRPQDVAAVMIPVLRTRPQMSQFILANARGQSLQIGELDGGWVVRANDPDKLGNRQHWTYLNREGSYLREEWIERERFDARTRPWFAGADALTNENAIYWTEPYLFFFNKAPGITTSMRYNDRNTGERMVLGIDVLLSDLSRYTTKVEVGTNGRAAILTRDGRVIGVPRHPSVRTDDDIKQRILKTLPEAGFSMHAAAFAGWNAHGRTDTHATPFSEAGEAWLGRFRPYQLRNQQLLIGTVAPRSDFVLGTLGDALAIAAMMALVLLLAYLFARRFATRFAGVMHALGAESARIGAMQLDGPVRVPTRIREVATLVDAQERMRQMLIDATQGLEDKVRERTAALNEALDRQSAIFAASPYGIGVFQNRRCVTCSPSFERTFGYGPGEFTGLGARELFRSEADFDTVGAQVYAATSRGEPHSYEVLMRRKDDSEFWCRVTAAPLTGQENQRGIVALYEDVTARKRAEEALRSAHGEMDAILESASIGIALTRAGQVVRCNAKAEELFGTGKGGLIGVTVQALFSTSGENTVPGALASLARGETHRREKVLTRRDGSTFWCRFAGRAVDSSDPSKGNVWMLEDITEEHAAAQALREAKQIAEDATQAKSMFLANMSHEIRTPMNAIIGLSHLALKTDLNPKQRDYVAKIHNAGTSLLGIINDILDFSKIEAGKLDMEEVPFRLDGVLDNVSALVAQKAYDKGLELLIDTAPDVPQSLVGDPLRLAQVITNLLTNAIKFTEQGQVAVKIRRVERAGGKVQLRVEVRDSGIGMTREQAARLFQPFTQADGSTTRKYGGTGLGLTICKRIVELMGGQIQVDSEAGSGSTFSFSCWLAVGAELPERRRVIPEALNGMRALVVDDNAAAREILCEMLRGLGLGADEADAGPAAIESVRGAAATGQPYGVAFIDWKMPGMDGLETARRLHEERSPPRMVMVTAFGRAELRDDSGLAGIEAFLVKPVSQSTLVDALVGLFAPDAGETAGLAQQGAEGPRLDGARLLLAEDNEINQQIAVELLTSAGAAVTVANNGREAVEKLAAGGASAYDAVLMDLQMPEMDGMEATRRIRADARYANLPIIAMTAHAMAEEREKCLAAGMVDHITKPIDPQAMFQTLARWVRPTPQKERAAIAGNRHEESIPVIAGLDAAAGLKRVAGNRRLYLSLLRQFAERQADAGARLASALSANDRSTAERIAHTVKGVAGNIGLAAVQAAAGTLEKAVATGQGLKTAMSKFETELAQAVAALQDALAAETPVAAAGGADPAETLAHGARIAALLGDSDGEAVDYLLANGGALRPIFADGGYAAFEKDVAIFDFEAALGKLRQAAAARGIKLDTLEA